MSSLQVRRASDRDAEAIAVLVNGAFAVEQWFVEGDRTSIADIRRLLGLPTSTFLVALDPEGEIVGCVQADRRSADRGYIGLLAVDASRSSQGIGHLLMQHAEQHLADAGCGVLELTVVDLRADLFVFYERLGYRRGNSLPFPRRSKQPCQLVEMFKSVRPSSSPRSR